MPVAPSISLAFNTERAGGKVRGFRPLGDVGKGAHEYLPGTYEFRWAGGDWVSGSYCQLILGATQTITDTFPRVNRLSWTSQQALPHGSPFTVTLTPNASPVFLVQRGGNCEGALHYVGESTSNE